MAAGLEARRASIELAKEDMHFSAAHFTIFSAAERENLHGHNFFVEARATGPVDGNGLCFDYSVLKSRLRALCASLDETLLLAAQSPHLEIEEDADGLVVAFADETLRFQLRDVKLLPIRNVTVEELAHWFAHALADDEGFASLPIDALTLRVSSGPGQWAEATWSPPSAIGGESS
ncbi:MAG: 6-pyruvoyl tetrahydropterin synthase [Gammaproteobacteria bacterium]|nr:6-pyruvoyl tetrahydropterin synthase [Gammaproteobacteria bacterium]